MSGKLTVSCLDWRSCERNTLLGFANIHIQEIRLTIRDVALHRKNEKRWASLPSASILKRPMVLSDWPWIGRPT